MSCYFVPCCDSNKSQLFTRSNTRSTSQKNVNVEGSLVLAPPPLLFFTRESQAESACSHTLPTAPGKNVFRDRARPRARPPHAFCFGAAACAGVPLPSCPHAPLRGPRELRISALFFRPRRAPPTPSSADSVFGKPRKGFFAPGDFGEIWGLFLGETFSWRKCFFFSSLLKNSS